MKTHGNAHEDGPEIAGPDLGTITLIGDLMRPSLIEAMIVEYDDMLLESDYDDETRNHYVEVLDWLRDLRDLMGYAK